MLRFDTSRLVRDFLDAIDKELDAVAQHGVEYMQSEIDRIPDSGPNTVGRSEWRSSVRSAIKYDTIRTKDMIIKRIGVLDQNDEFDSLLINRALLINYGMGSLLSRQNPYLDEYTRSVYYNTNRQGYTVFTRPGDLIYDYDTGDWYTSGAGTVYPIEAFAQPPSFYFENAMKLIQDEYHQAMERVFATFDFAPYLVSDVK